MGWRVDSEKGRESERMIRMVRSPFAAMGGKRRVKDLVGSVEDSAEEVEESGDVERWLTSIESN